MNDFELVIIGGGLASARAIKSYRAAGGEGRILLVSKDSALPYHRPPLSKRYLRGEAEARDAFVEPETLMPTTTPSRCWARSGESTAASARSSSSTGDATATASC